LLNRGAHYPLNCAERQRTAAGTPSVVANWRKRYAAPLKPSGAGKKAPWVR
jgi:hypothetical protein